MQALNYMHMIIGSIAESGGALLAKGLDIK